MSDFSIQEVNKSPLQCKLNSTFVMRSKSVARRFAQGRIWFFDFIVLTSDILLSILYPCVSVWLKKGLPSCEELEGLHCIWLWIFFFPSGNKGMASSVLFSLWGQCCVLSPQFDAHQDEECNFCALPEETMHDGIFNFRSFSSLWHRDSIPNNRMNYFRFFVKVTWHNQTMRLYLWNKDLKLYETRVLW